MTTPLNRRLLLQLLAISSAGAAIGCGPDDETADELEGSRADALLSAKKKVIVIGGGLAGLCSAHELRKKGFNVLAVLEAQNRVGGRVLTVRQGLLHGQYAEAGATRIADTHNYTLAYVAEFGLPLREFGGGQPALYDLKGQPPFIHQDGTPWPQSVLNFPPAQQSMGADSIFLSYENLGELGDPLEVTWPTGKALDYNNLGIEDYLKGNGANDDVILLDNAVNGSELKRDGALYWLMADIVDAQWDKTYAIEGGNDKLPAAFAAALGGIVKLRSVVTAIHQTASAVTVTYSVNGGPPKTLTADHCVCAIPFSTLRNVQCTPALSPAKAAAVSGLSMMPVSRCYLQTKTRFWNQQGIGGLKVARTDTPIERLWDMTQVQCGTSGILLAYMQGDNALTFGALPNAQKVNYVKTNVAQFFPEIGTQVEAAVYKVWQDDPWAGGAWAYYKAGEMASWFPAAKQSEGRVHFCGEHTSAWSGWMQGALESANRVVAELDV